MKRTALIIAAALAVSVTVTVAAGHVDPAMPSAAKITQTR